MNPAPTEVVFAFFCMSQEQLTEVIQLLGSLVNNKWDLEMLSLYSRQAKTGYERYHVT